MKLKEGSSEPDIYLGAKLKADPDLWLKPQSRADGTSYYSYILCYVDDVIVVHENA